MKTIARSTLCIAEAPALSSESVPENGIDASGSDAGGKDAGSEMALTGQSKTILDMMKGLFKEFAQTTDAKIERLSQEVAARTKRDRNESDSESESDASVRSTECKKRRKTESDPDVLVVQEDINLDETELAFLKRKAAEAEPNTSAKADASGLSKFAKVEQELSEPEKLGPKYHNKWSAKGKKKQSSYYNNSYKDRQNGNYPQN
nr:hypothetical protein BaRGS_013349 [Batillaria attramentaria]